MTFDLDLLGIEVLGDGIPSFKALEELLPRGGWAPTGTPVAAPACLPSRTARRVSPEIRLALAVAERIGPALPPEAAWVFASSTGEGETLTQILDALREPGMAVKPIRFQNAVHNAAIGQWTIAAGATGPATSIAAHDESFGAGLLKAALQCRLEGRSVGLVGFDLPLPAPLDEKRPMGVPLAVAMGFAPGSGDGTRLSLSVGRGEPSRPATPLGRELHATGNPMAAAMPLIEALAGQGAETLRLGIGRGAVLEIEVTR